MQRAFELIRDGIKNRSSLFHTLTMSTIHDQEIYSRVMVLRDFNASKRFLRFHSDYRSKKVLVSTDFLVEGIHFDLSYMPLKHLGYKAIIVNISDIYAMRIVAYSIISNSTPTPTLHLNSNTAGVWKPEIRPQK